MSGFGALVLCRVRLQGAAVGWCLRSGNAGATAGSADGCRCRVPFVCSLIDASIH